MNEEIHDFFVYGTLKRHQCRESCWPCAPQDVFPAIVTATLYDLGPYPAMMPGNQTVLGEIWSFDANTIAAVTETLDQIERFNQPGETDLYRRVIIPWQATSANDRQGSAFTYYYADSSMLAGQPLQAAEHGWVYWPSSARL